jgi:hypothetical protein
MLEPIRRTITIQPRTYKVQPAEPADQQMYEDDRGRKGQRGYSRTYSYSKKFPRGFLTRIPLGQLVSIKA